MKMRSIKAEMLTLIKSCNAHIYECPPKTTIQVQYLS